MKPPSEYMEFTSNQIAALNSMLPTTFRFDPVDSKEKETKEITGENPKSNALTQELNPSATLPVKRAQPGTDQPKADLNVVLGRILNTLRTHPDYSRFLTNLDSIDFSAIEGKLRNNEYKTLLDFSSETRKVWDYYLLSEDKGSEVYFTVMDIRVLTESLVKKAERILRKNGSRETTTQGETKLALIQQKLTDPLCQIDYPSLPQIQKTTRINTNASSDEVEPKITRLPEKSVVTILKPIEDKPKELSNIIRIKAVNSHAKDKYILDHDEKVIDG